MSEFLLMSVIQWGLALTEQPTHHQLSLQCFANKHIPLMQRTFVLTGSVCLGKPDSLTIYTHGSLADITKQAAGMPANSIVQKHSKCL